MRCTVFVLAALAGCNGGPQEAFVVDGFVDVAPNPRAAVIGLFELPTTPPTYYKLGDGVRLDRNFTLGFDTDPPRDALGPDGVGVAYVVMLPELTTVPDGPVDPATLGILGISSDTAVIYKLADATAPAWASPFAPRFSCAQCQRSSNGLDSFTLAACASVLVEGPASPTCNWF